MNIAIAGYGLEGRSNYTYWSKIPGAHVTIVDEQPIVDAPIDAATISGADAFMRLDGFDLVVRTAGLAPRKIKTDGKIWSATNEFFEKCPAPIIGVTGSKGKGTTSSFIAAILKAAGKKVWLVGNIGVAALDVLPDIAEGDIVVYELSSFQLWDIERSPHIAVVVHIEPDHLDVHADFNEYIEAKANITRYQALTDRVVFDAQNQWSSHIAEQTVGQRLPYPTERTVHVRGDSFFYGDTVICQVDNVLLPGEHNLQNACAAITAVWPWVQDGAVIAEGLRSFNGLPHRLKLVREVAGVRYYDDSIATTPGSAIAAAMAFAAPKIMIIGGSYKGADFSGLAATIAQPERQVKTVLLIGDEATRIAKSLDEAGYGDYKMMADESFVDVIRAAADTSHAGDVVILSPACASFGQFKNYADRGEQFIAAVNDLSA